MSLLIIYSELSLINYPKMYLSNSVLVSLLNLWFSHVVSSYSLRGVVR